MIISINKVIVDNQLEWDIIYYIIVISNHSIGDEQQCQNVKRI